MPHPWLYLDLRDRHFLAFLYSFPTYVGTLNMYFSFACFDTWRKWNLHCVTSSQVAVCSLVCGSHCFIVHFILLTPLTVDRLLGPFQFGAILHGLDFKVSTKGEIVHPSTILASSWVLRYTERTSVSGLGTFCPPCLEWSSSPYLCG